MRRQQVDGPLARKLAWLPVVALCLLRSFLVQMQRTAIGASAEPPARAISRPPCTAHLLINTHSSLQLRRQTAHGRSIALQGKGKDKVSLMASGGSLYAVLGVSSDCSDAELRTAYRKLAMKWHPDKFAQGSSASSAEAAKVKFQKIQGAYAVLSDPNKRILYDVGAYDSDGDDDGQGEILGDILEAMSKTGGPSENGKGETLEDMQRQFEELFLRPSASFCSPGDAGKSRRAGRK